MSYLITLLFVLGLLVKTCISGFYTLEYFNYFFFVVINVLNCRNLERWFNSHEAI